MGFRFWIVVAPLMLSGCSTLSSFSWSTLSPFHWFSSGLHIDNDGVGGVSASTPMQQEAVSQGLDGAYTLRSGMGIDNGQVTRFFQAMAQDKVAMTIAGDATVMRITVDSADLATAWGARVGTPFAALYARAYDGECRRVAAAEATSVICRAPQSARVSYLVHGQWGGPAGLMPPDDVLKSWTVSQIVWQADAQ